MKDFEALARQMRLAQIKRSTAGVSIKHNNTADVRWNGEYAAKARNAAKALEVAVGEALQFVDDSDLTAAVRECRQAQQDEELMRYVPPYALVVVPMLAAQKKLDALLGVAK